MKVSKNKKQVKKLIKENNEPIPSLFFENENCDFEKYFCSFSKNIFFSTKKKS